MAEKLEISELFSIIKEKIANQDPKSYSYKIVQDGVKGVTRKIGEESVEVIIAAFLNEKEPNSKNKEDLVNEICDLIYHTLVLAASQNIEIDDILKEFSNRNKKYE